MVHLRIEHVQCLQGSWITTRLPPGLHRDAPYPQRMLVFVVRRMRSDASGLLDLSSLQFRIASKVSDASRGGGGGWGIYQGTRSAVIPALSAAVDTSASQEYLAAPSCWVPC